MSSGEAWTSTMPSVVSPFSVGWVQVSQAPTSDRASRTA